jgi:uncharacterized protein (TIGR02147 family)
VRIFDYLEYREYLDNWYSAKKQDCSWFSFKVFGKGVGLDPSQVYRILAGKLHVSKAAASRFVDYLQLDKREEQYFLLLIDFAKTKSETKAKELFQSILAMRGSRSHLLKNEQFRMYEEWYHPVVRSLINVLEISDNYEVLARSVSPALQVAQVKSSLNHLRRLQLIERDSQGIWRACEPSVTTGSNFHSLMVREYQRQSFTLAQESLSRVPKDLRDINVINMAVDQTVFEDCIAILEEARAQILRRVEDVKKPDRIMRLAQAYFPVAQFEVTQ